MNFTELRRQAEENPALRASVNSQEARRLMETLDGKVDGKAVEQAMRSGDVRTMQEFLNRVLSTPEGRALAEQVRKLAGGNG